MGNRPREKQVELNASHHMTNTTQANCSGPKTENCCALVESELHMSSGAPEYNLCTVCIMKALNVGCERFGILRFITGNYSITNTKKCPPTA